MLYIRFQTVKRGKKHKKYDRWLKRSSEIFGVVIYISPKNRSFKKISVHPQTRRSLRLLCHCLVWPLACLTSGLSNSWSFRLLAFLTGELCDRQLVWLMACLTGGLSKWWLVWLVACLTGGLSNWWLVWLVACLTIDLSTIGLTDQLLVWLVACL